METENQTSVQAVTAAQQQLIIKLLKSRVFKDSEYQQLQKIYSSRVATSYDAAILINYLLGTLRFRRTFLNGKHKAYKKCSFCKTRDDVERYEDLHSRKKFWSCPTCYINLDHKEVYNIVPVRQNE